MRKERSARRQKTALITELFRTILGTDLRTAKIGSVDGQGNVHFDRPADRVRPKGKPELPYVDKVQDLTTERVRRSKAEREARITMYAKHVQEIEEMGREIFRRYPTNRATPKAVKAIPAGARAFERVEATYPTVRDAARSVMEMGLTDSATIDAVSSTIRTSLRRGKMVFGFRWEAVEEVESAFVA